MNVPIATNFMPFFLLVPTGFHSGFCSFGVDNRAGLPESVATSSGVPPLTCFLNPPGLPLALVAIHLIVSNDDDGPYCVSDCPRIIY